MSNLRLLALSVATSFPLSDKNATTSDWWKIFAHYFPHCLQPSCKWSRSNMDCSLIGVDALEVLNFMSAGLISECRLLEYPIVSAGPFTSTGRASPKKRVHNEFFRLPLDSIVWKFSSAICNPNSDFHYVKLIEPSDLNNPVNGAARSHHCRSMPSTVTRRKSASSPSFLIQMSAIPSGKSSIIRSWTALQIGLLPSSLAIAVLHFTGTSS